MKRNKVVLYWIGIIIALGLFWYIVIALIIGLFNETKIEYRKNECKNCGLQLEYLPTTSVTQKNYCEVKACWGTKPIDRRISAARTELPATNIDAGVDGVGTASYYSQENLIQSRKNLTGGGFGVAMHNTNLGDRFMVCLQADSSRCIYVTHNDYCEGCMTMFPGRVFDLQEEAFAELAPLHLGVLKVVYKKI